MNSGLEIIFFLLQQLKIGTHAQYVSFSTASYGMEIRVDWEDNCHAIYALGEQEVKSANYDITKSLTDYFNNEHDKVKEK